MKKLGRKALDGTAAARQRLQVGFCAALVGGKRNLAELAGIGPPMVSRYLSGEVEARSETLDRLARAAGVPRDWLDEICDQGLRFRERSSGEPDLTRTLFKRLSAGFSPDAPERLLSADFGNFLAPRAEDRDQVAALWEKLLGIETEDRPKMVAALPSFHSWALAEWLGDESERRVVHAVPEALDLARLAVVVAEQVPGPPLWRERNVARARAFLGNAYRVAGNLDAARRMLPAARRKFERAERGDPSLLLDPSRPLDLEASLRRGERRFADALALLGRAAERSPTAAGRGRIALKRAYTLRQAERVEEAVAVLRAATPEVDRHAEPRCGFGLRFNLAECLLELGRLAEAEELLPEVKARAEALGNDHDLVRVEWLEARFQAARGDLLDAISRLDRVRLAFIARGMSYDTALAALELAALYLETGDPLNVAKARALASDVAPIFKAQGVQREALAAVRLFVETARRGALTEKVVRSALSALRVGRG